LQDELILRIAKKGQEFLEDKNLYIIIFIIGLLLSICVSHPQFLINDEWITGNQLAQIDQGHQFLYTEGKYGAYPNGTQFSYFQTKNNLLIYPLFLPIISFPVLKIIKTFGDTFDYWLMTFWSLLLIFLGILIQKYYPRLLAPYRINLSSLLIILAFIIFFANMILYQPFTISPDTAPREAAAIILTSNILFAGTVVAIFTINSTLFQNRAYALFGTFVCVANSSYLIWASSGKDHMLEIFLFSLIILGIIKFIYTEKNGWSYFSFFLIGLLAWDRPEIGPFVMLFLFISLAPIFIKKWKSTNNLKHLGYLLISPLFTVIGMIPMFVNNFIVTKNPFIPVQLVGAMEPINKISANISSVPSGNVGGVPDILAKVLQFAFPQAGFNFNSLLHNLTGILFLPEIGTTGVIILVPIFAVGLISVPILVLNKRGNLISDDLNCIIPLGLMTISFFMAYVTYFPILNLDPGVAPDIRYLSPVYICLNLIGLIILSKFPDFLQNLKTIIKYFLLFTSILIIIFLVIISMATTKNEFYPVFFEVSFWISIAVIFTTIGSILLTYLYFHGNLERKPFFILMGLLISLPFVWQIMTNFLIVNMANSYAGYTFWLPVVVHFNHALFQLI
jgi:hypothetical protein